jgi:hypothetical protein
LKKIFLICAFVLTSFLCFAQFDISEAISVLEKPVPTDFNRINRTTFTKNNVDGSSFVIFIENNIVVLSLLGYAFPTSDQAYRWLAQFYSIAEVQNWNFYSSEADGEVYKKDDIYFVIASPQKRVDGMITASVYITKNLKYLK